MLLLRSFLQQYRQNIVMRVMLVVIEMSRMIANATEIQDSVVRPMGKVLFIVVVVVVVVVAVVIIGVVTITDGVLESVPPVTLIVGVIGVVITD